METAPIERPAPVRMKSGLESVWLAIILAPAAVGFVIAACLSGGPTEVFKALTGRK